MEFRSEMLSVNRPFSRPSTCRARIAAATSSGVSIRTSTPSPLFREKKAGSSYQKGDYWAGDLEFGKTFVWESFSMRPARST